MELSKIFEDFYTKHPGSKFLSEIQEFEISLKKQLMGKRKINQSNGLIKYLQEMSEAINQSQDSPLTIDHIQDAYDDLLASLKSSNSNEIRKIKIKKAVNSLLYFMIYRTDDIQDHLKTELMNFRNDKFQDIKNHSHKKEERFLSESDYVKLIKYDSSVKRTLQEKKLIVLIKFIYNSGFTLTEAIFIKKTQFQEDSFRIKIVIQNKEGFISKKIWDEINNLFHGDIYLFETARNHQYTRNFFNPKISDYSEKVLGRRITPIDIKKRPE